MAGLYSKMSSAVALRSYVPFGVRGKLVADTTLCGSI
jgi:hypothetical protein